MAHSQLYEVIKGDALVLVHFGPRNSPHAEVVYNLETPWPDDARIIKAHDLGPEMNMKILEYYADRQPQREVWLLDRATLRLAKLGVVSEMVKDTQSVRSAMPQ
jgi:hypothetical protein